MKGIQRRVQVQSSTLQLKVLGKHYFIFHNSILNKFLFYRPLDVEAFLENENHAPQLPKNTILLPSGWNESHTQFSVQNLYSIL